MDWGVISTAEELTRERLTAVLRKAGVLQQGEVASIPIEDFGKTFASRTWRIKVSYSSDALPESPTRLFLKCSSPEYAPGQYDSRGIEKEFEFYSSVVPAMDVSPSVPCFDAAYDKETGASHLLLLDVSGTHVTSHDPQHVRNCERAVEKLAELHAFWWDHARLGKDVGRFPSENVREQGWADAEKAVGEFLSATGTRLSEKWRENYERVVRSLPHLGKRHAEGRDLTLAHGDAHLGNFLFPRDDSDGPAYLIDWQFWHPTIGGTDLAFMIATDWEPLLRRRLEEPLLRRYHESLLEHGVEGYDWERCWNDYRLSVMLVSIFIPVWQFSVFGWEPNLIAVERSMRAFEELGCEELLEGSR